MRLACVLGGLALSLAGCSESGGRFACNNRATSSQCADFPRGTAQRDVQAQCTSTVLQTTCPADHVATCTITGSQSQIALINRYYADGPRPYTVASAKAACDGFGGALGTP